MTQASLFDNPAQAPIARKSDPLSSKLAGEQITRSGHRDAQKHKILAALQNEPIPITSAELACRMGMDRYAVARRLPELEKDGLVVKVGMRGCSTNGRQAVTWRRK